MAEVAEATTLDFKSIRYADQGNGEAITLDLKSTLSATEGRDFVRENGRKVLISDIEGNTVALHFCSRSYEFCLEFTSKLVETYNELKGMGEKFEPVLISLDDDEQAHKEDLKSIPFLYG